MANEYGSVLPSAPSSRWQRHVRAAARPTAVALVLLASLREPLTARASATALFLPQGGSGLRAPATATAGGTIVVEGASSESTIEVTDPVTGATQSFPVDPSKRTSIPIPAVPPGSILVVS